MSGLFDVVFLGGGPAGYQGAVRSAQLGQRVALVEDRELGGVCLNRGCIPTKAIRASAELALRARRGREWGLDIPSVRPDMAAVLARKDKVVGLLRGGVEQLVRANRIALFRGLGVIRAPGVIEVSTNEGRLTVRARRVVVCSGALSRVPAPLVGVPGVVTTDELLSLVQLPQSLVVVGAGAVGVEMAAIMAALGVQVTMVESQDRILPHEDAEMAAYLARMLRRLKVRVLTGVTVEQATAGALTAVQLSDGTQLAAEKVLAATGWAPRVEGIGLENADIECHQGAVAVNERLQTSHPAVFAAGDVIGGWMLAHVAFAEGIVAAENAAGLERPMDYRVVPRCVFALPEFAAVGLTEAQATAQGTVDVVRFPLKTLGMAQALGEWEGLVKLVVEASSGQLLGGHVIGAHASELVAEMALAMRHRIPVRGIMETIHAHPTMSEAVLEAAQAACGQSIHLLPGSGQWG